MVEFNPDYEELRRRVRSAKGRVVEAKNDWENLVREFQRRFPRAILPLEDRAL